MGTLWIDSFKTSVRLDEIKDTASLGHAKRMLKRCCSRLHNIKSGAGSKHNPGEADDLHEHIIPVLVKAIKHAASSVGRCKMSKIEDIFSEAGNMAEEMRKFADQLESLSQKGLGFAQDVQLCLGDADQLGDERDEVPSAPGGDELERASATSPRKRRRSGHIQSSDTPRRPRKPILPTPKKETLEARPVVGEEEVALRVTRPELTQIVNGSKREDIRTRTPYFKNKLLKAGLSQIRFFAGRCNTTKGVTASVRSVVDDDAAQVIKIMIGNILVPREPVPEGEVLEGRTVQEATSGFAGCRSSEEEEEEKEESETASQQGDQWRKRWRLRPGATAPSPVTAPVCMLCDDDTHIPRPCSGCPVVMCMECWEQQSGLTEVLCTRCFQETDKEELRRMAEAGDEDAEQLLRKKEEEEEKDKKEGAAAAEDAEQEHSD